MRTWRGGLACWEAAPSSPPVCGKWRRNKGVHKPQAGLSQGIEQAWARLAGLLRRCALASVTCRRSCLGSDSWSLGAAAPYSSQHPFPQPGQGARAGIATASVAGSHGCHCLYPLRTGLSLPSVVGEGKQRERRKRAAQFRTVSICFPNSKGLLRIH